ncbi:flagellar hook-basal body protein [bacterium AH-315-J21]|nr:flagellar hook-basal body protein [bacterium AH-315-J21]
MIKGIYNSASAMIPRIRQQEVIANNIANASTPGFKKDSVFMSELSKAQVNNLPGKSDWERPMLDQVYTDYGQGSLDQTGNPLDIAIDGPGFFVTQDSSGDSALTRDGVFTRDALGFMVTTDGDMVLSDSGPILLPPGDVSVADDGVVSVDGAEISRLNVVTVEDPTTLVKVRPGKYQIPEGVELTSAVNFAVRQGFVEGSNVDVVMQMVEMISSYRNYEADSKALQTQDESLGRLISEVGRTQ